MIYSKLLTHQQIQKLGETNPVAADAALQRLVAERTARIDEADEEAIRKLDAVDRVYAKQPIEHSIHISAKPETPQQREIRLYSERRKVANSLRKVGLTPADLPADFWEKSRVERDLIFHKIYTKALNEREAAKAAAMTVASKPAPLSGKERTRQWRTRKPKPTLTGGPMQFETPNAAWIADRFASLRTWTATRGRRQEKLRGRERELVRAAAIYQHMTGKLSRAPSHNEFGARLRCGRRGARSTIEVLAALYLPGGPWHPGV